MVLLIGGVFVCLSFSSLLVIMLRLVCLCSVGRCMIRLLRW